MKTDMCTTCAAPFLCTRAFRFLLEPACRPRARLALHSQIGRKPYQEFSLNALVFAILCGVGPTGVAEPSVKENVSHAQPLSYARAPEATNACFCWPWGGFPGGFPRGFPWGFRGFPGGFQGFPSVWHVQMSQFLQYGSFCQIRPNDIIIILKEGNCPETPNKRF